MPKYYIRLTDDMAPAPIYYQRIAGLKPQFTPNPGFAKRFENLELAREMCAKLKDQTSERDGECSLIEIIDAETAQPVTDDPPEQPEREPGNGGWDVRFEFRQTSTGALSTYEMQKTPEGVKCRYTTMSGNTSTVRPRSQMHESVQAWLDCISAWLHAQIDAQGAKGARKE